MGRNTGINNLTGTMFDQMELVKGHTPDKGADSLGGTLNMRTRSTLTMKEKRRITYNASVRIAPSFTDQIPEREKQQEEARKSADELRDEKVESLSLLDNLVAAV